MKPIFQVNRHLFATRTSRVSSKTDYDYQAATPDDVDGGFVGSCKPAFHAIGRDYFAREAHHDLASETMVFCLLMLATIVPLLNGADAVIGLLRSTGGAF